MADITYTVSQIRPAPGAVIKRKVAAVALAPGDLVYLTGSDTADKADADAAGSAQAIGVVVSVPDGGAACVAGDTVDVCVFGELFGFTTLTPGALYYTSTTAGKISDTRPAGASGDFAWIVGRGWSAGSLFINPFTDIFTAL